MALSWSEVRSAAELLILIFLTIRAIGQAMQKQQDLGSAQTVRLEGHAKQLDFLTDRVQALREIRVADRLSRLESSLLNLEARLREEFVTKPLCDERTRGAEKTRNHDHPHKTP